MPGPPRDWSTALSTMRMTLSREMVRKGVRPKSSTLPMRGADSRSGSSRMGMSLRRSMASTKTQEAAWDSTVAQAAPATPMPRGTMNTTSRTMFSKEENTRQISGVRLSPRARRMLEIRL